MLLECWSTIETVTHKGSGRLFLVKEVTVTASSFFKPYPTNKSIDIAV